MLRRRFDPNRPLRYVRYGRMSDDQQNPRSPDQQFETIEQVRKRMSYPWVWVRDFRDDAISGRLLRKRKGFQEMRRVIMTGTIAVDLILIDTYERFGRADELAQIRRELYNKFGVLILTADSNFADPTSVAGRALSFVEQIRSTEDGRVKAHNVLRGKRDLIRQKKAWPGGPPPFGYKLQSIMGVGKNGEQVVDFKILVRDPETDWIVDRIFQMAHGQGWGATRLTRFFKTDPTMPEKTKSLSAATVGYILDNPIYHGELLWEEHATGIVDDTRVIERNAEEDMLRVPGFCEPIVSRALWEEVQTVRQKRREQLAQRRTAASDDGKQISPLAPGLTLKYLLSGLVRCEHCKASMRPNSTKRQFKSGRVWRRLYYACPTALEGSCPNGRYLPADWLREAVLARLRSRLLPWPSQPERLPDWFTPLVEEIRQELEISAEKQPDQHSAWQREKEVLQERVKGWSLSLANPRLDTLLRTDIEQQYGPAKAQIAHLDDLLAERNRREEHLADVLDGRQVLDRLRRLAEILATNNPTRGNMELGLHIDRIDCFVDGRVQMRTSKLGIFDGAVELLRRPNLTAASNGPDTVEAKPLRQVRPRRRARHRLAEELTTPNNGLTVEFPVNDPRRFADLEDRWFWHDNLEIPRTASWAEANKAEVAQLRASGRTMAQLAAHFGKTVPTIRNALRKASQTDETIKDLPKKMPRRRWAEDHAAEVAQLQQTGLCIAALARHFGKSDPTIRAALKHAATLHEHAAPPPTDQVEPPSGDVSNEP